MKTSLQIETPPDLSIGRLRINDDKGTIVQWVTTPDHRSFSLDDMRPGIYSAEIAPTGVAPQAVIFEVKEGQANTVFLPSFSALASGGGNTNFYDMATQRATLNAPTSELSIRSRNTRELSLLPIAATNLRVGIPKFEPLRIADGTRRMSAALSQEASGHREAYGEFAGTHRVELSGNGIVVEVHRPDFRFEPGDRVRLSVSIESLRIERCLVPMYLGGTTISLTPAPLSVSDVSIEIMPSELRLRAMVRALGAGTVEDARAVRQSVSPPPVESFFPISAETDPWTALVYGLLTIRFPQVFPELDEVWTEELVMHAGWAFDAHIIQAHRILTFAGDNQHRQIAAAVDAIGHLAQAQAAGAPYYSYTNELFGEITAGLSDPENSVTSALPSAVRDRLARIVRRWSRESPLQRGAGVAFSWLRRDQKALKKTGTLIPNRRSTGILRGRDTTVVFQGRLATGRITVGIVPGRRLEDQLGSDVAGLGVPNQEQGWRLDCPALHRDPGPTDDPNNKRFGEKAECGGYSLEAFFGRAKRRGWISITLVVTAAPEVDVELGAEAWFFLHPTFSPSRIKVRFRGNRASLTIEAWGGFTVGVWIPSVQVELESDLAQLEHAPAIIRER